ncbi:MAG: LuxR C-terminal-related transcriptional regulator [Acidimicrobiia bacterium]|nr:LuxR C-terminal-related transcriptional regulator [Acidimicrobiia bacterium]
MTARNGAGTVVVPLQELLEAMSDGVLITDENGRCTYSNRSLDDLVGMKACDPALREDAPGWISLPHQNDYRRLITRALNGRIPRRPQSVDWNLVSVEGEAIPTTTKIIPMHNGVGPSAALLWIFTPAPGEARVIHDPRKRELEDAMRRIADEVARAGLTGSTSTVEPAPSHPDLELLSRRERDVVTHLLQGHRVVSIAELLEVSEHTVRNHLKSIFRKLGVHSQAELVDRLHNTSVAS